MKAWLEKTSGGGDDLVLPDAPATLVFGRSSKATIVFDDNTISPKHLELKFDGTFWLVRDLGTERGTFVNGAELSHPRALFTGDVIQFGLTRLTFRAEQHTADEAFIDAIAERPDSDEPWLVYADWLLERGDPLGERMAKARAGQRTHDELWLGPLQPHLESGALELGWNHGFIRSATLRKVAGKLSFDWRHAASTLLSCRVGRLTRELVIDVPRLRPDRSSVVDEIVRAEQFLAELPNIGRSLNALSLGYSLTSGDSLKVGALLELKAPRLKGQTLLRLGVRPKLVQLSQVDVANFTGLTNGERLLTDVTRVRRGERRNLHFETPPGLATLIADGNPCYFAAAGTGWTLTVGKLRGEVRVNQRVDSTYFLLPGDVIDFQGAGKFRFELLP